MTLTIGQATLTDTSLELVEGRFFSLGGETHTFDLTTLDGDTLEDLLDHVDVGSHWFVGMAVTLFLGDGVESKLSRDFVLFDKRAES